MPCSDGQVTPLQSNLWPHNIALSSPPPTSLELNPAENVWQFIRDTRLSKRIFKSYRDILDHCCYAWNRRIEQTWLIIAIGQAIGLRK